jgi:hypothetical protein
MVTGALPQLKVMTPPVCTAAVSAAAVQLAAVPVPTTVVGFEVSAAMAAAGTVQAAAGGTPWDMSPGVCMSAPWLAVPLWLQEAASKSATEQTLPIVVIRSMGLSRLAHFYFLTLSSQNRVDAGRR